MNQKFADLVPSTKVSACPSCASYVYTLPFALNADVQESLAPLGNVKYDLKKYKIFKIDNENFVISSRINTNKITVKFKTDIDNNKKLFEIHLAGYVELKMNCKIEV